MIPLEGPTRIAGIKASDIRIQPMGATPGVRAKFALVDENSNPLSMMIGHHFSNRTFELVEQLQESMELDMANALMLGTPESSDEEQDVGFG